MKKNKGITLIALVITIIVLLILAGVTIATLTGDNGLLQKATTAKQENEDSKELELIKLAVSAAQVAGEGKLTKNNIENELRANFDDENITVTQLTSGWKYKKYKIFEDGNVEEYKSILPEEYQELEYIESTGTQYLFIGEVAMSNVIAEMQYPNFPNGCDIIGGMDGEGNNGRLALGLNSSLSTYKLLYGNKAETSNIKSDNTKHKYKINITSPDKKTAELSVDNNYICSVTADYISHPLYFTLFAYTGWGRTTPNNFSSCRIFYFELEGQMKLYPCYRKSDNKIGMYDTINSKFYTNQATGNDFTPGPKL